MTHRSNKNIFKLSKKALACSMAIASISSASFVQAASPSPLLEPISAITKFKAVKNGEVIPDQYIVVFKDQYVNQQVTNTSGQTIMSAPATIEQRRLIVTNMSQEMANLYGANVKHRYHAALSGFVAKMSRKGMNAMLADDRVAYIEQDQIMRASVTQNNPTWGLDRIDQTSLPLNSQYNYTADGSGVNAYVIDTGVMVSHSDFAGRARNGWDFVDNDSIAEDCAGHGTHVAGSIGSSTYGVAKNVTLTAVRVLGCGGSGANSGVIAGVDWVAQNAVRPAVANMSLGGGNSTALDNAVQNAINNGVTFAVAAGNSNSDACVGSPNRVPAALTIASSTINDARSVFSSWGSCIDLFAPGSNITSTWNNGSNNTISGTSMASPQVAGVAALYLQNNPGASAATVNAAILSNAASGKISDVKGSPNLLLQSQFGGATPPPPPPTGGVLSKGVSVSGLSGATGSDVFYTMEVPAGATNLSFKINGGSGDADVYARFGAKPTTNVYDCRPFSAGNNESCDINNASTGTYHVMLRGFASYSGVSLVGDYTSATPPPPPPPGGGNFFENTANVAIPDNNTTGITSDVSVNKSGQSGSISIAVDIKHTYIGDLIVEIVAPNGATGMLSNRAGGSADNLIQTYTLNAGAITAAGTWKLKVRDLANQDTGFIDSWSITFQ